jgi:hypothetical protein
MGPAPSLGVTAGTGKPRPCPTATRPRTNSTARWAPRAPRPGPGETRAQTDISSPDARLVPLRLACGCSPGHSPPPHARTQPISPRCRRLTPPPAKQQRPIARRWVTTRRAGTTLRRRQTRSSPDGDSSAPSTRTPPTSSTRPPTPSSSPRTVSARPHGPSGCPAPFPSSISPIFLWASLVSVLRSTGGSRAVVVAARPDRCDGRDAWVGSMIACLSNRTPR